MTETITTTSPATIWETYTSSWKAKTESERRGRFDASLSPSCVYTDPLTTASGWEALTGYMDDFHQQIPGGHFTTTWFNFHDGQSIARWDMVTGDGTKVGEGVSHGRYGADGMLVSMTGFFETDSAEQHSRG